MAEKEREKERAMGEDAAEEAGEKKGRDRKKRSKEAAEAEGTWHCITCQKSFTPGPGEKPRCPECLSIHSVEPRTAAPRRVKLEGRNLRLAVIIAVLAAAAAGGYLFLRSRYGGGGGAAALGYGLGHEALVKLLKEKGIAEEDLFDPFLAGDDLEAFAEANASGFSKGEKLFTAFMALRDKGNFTGYVPRQARAEPFMKAGDVYAAIRKNARKELYSLELAAMLVAAMRLAGLPAAVARVDDYAGMQAPLDPSGNVGHYAAALFERGSHDGPAVLYDLHQGKATPSTGATFTALTDQETVAASFGHMAYRLSGVAFDTTAALARIEDALRLHPAGAEYRTLKGLIFISSGGIEEGTQELRKALTMRQDAQRHLKWGAVLLAQEKEEEAIAELEKAIELKKRYSAAHATLAMALLASGESVAARKELDTAREIDPEDPLIPMYEANYYLERGQVDRAMGYAEKAFEKNGADPQVGPQIGLLLASLYQKTGQRGKAAAVIRKIIETEGVPDELKEQLADKFGIDEEDEEEEEDDGVKLDLGGIGGKKGGLLKAPGGGSLGGGGGDDDEEWGEGGGQPFKLNRNAGKGGLLTGKGSGGLDLQIH